MSSNKGHFQAGQPSRNPSGRPKGTRNPGTLMREALVQYGKKTGGDTEEILLNTIISQAVTGCLISQKLIVDRLIPSLRGISAPVTLPRLPKDLFKKGERILSLATAGDITIDEANNLLSSISVLLRAKEQTELTDRLTAIEEKLKNE